MLLTAPRPLPIRPTKSPVYAATKMRRIDGGGIRRKGAKPQRCKEEVGLANPAHQTVSVGLGAMFAVFPCVFASLR
jgi:hypothetical protein